MSVKAEEEKCTTVVPHSSPVLCYEARGVLSPTFLLCGGKEKEQCSIGVDKATYARGCSSLAPPELARTSHGVLKKRVSFRSPFKVPVGVHWWMPGVSSIAEA